MTVTGSNPNATDIILGANQFNDPPPEGFVYYLVDVEATYNGSEVGDPFDLNISAVGDGNLSYNRFCGAYDGELDLFADVVSGGTLTGSRCFVVPVDEVESLVVYARGDFSAETITFFSVN